MPKGYIIARVSVDDPDTYALYAKGAFAAMQKYGARILARGGRSEALEGEARARNVILEFESYDQAKAIQLARVPGGAPPPRRRQHRRVRARGRLRRGAAMSKGYWIARVDVHDPQAYQGYLDRNGKAFAKYGARFVVRGGPVPCRGGRRRGSATSSSSSRATRRRSTA